MKRRILVSLVGVVTLIAGLLSGGLVASSATGETLLGASTPPVVHDPDTVPVTVGVEVAARVAGSVSALRFYKGPQNVGMHLGALYSRSGTELARVTFTGETASGWQTANLSSPVSLPAGEMVTVAVFMPRGRYSVGNPQRWPIQTPALSGTRGVYNYSSSLARPTRVFESSNYFVDLVFNTVAPTPSPTSRPTVTTSPTATPRPTVTTSPSMTASPTVTPRPTVTASPSPTQSATSTSSPSNPPSTGWPDSTNTGVSGCPPLEKVANGDEVRLATRGQVYENKELLNPAVIRVVANDVTIRCVKMNGTGWFGIDNTDLSNPAANPNDTLIDRVEISCQKRGQRIGILAEAATVTRANVYDCDHFMNAGGDNLVIRDNYCHDLTDLPVVHADCIQTMGGNINMLIEHNSLWSRDTSDILLGQEFGDARNVVINNNRLMSVGSPPPAYLLYLSGTNTRVTNNRFTRRYTYGACTLNTNNPVVWSGNVWDDNGAPMSSCGAR